MEYFNKCFKAIQCYSCFMWCDHLRNECPTKYEPICSHCSRPGHNFNQCPNEYKCVNCGRAHPATARICPEYSIAVEKHLSVITTQLVQSKVITSENSPPSDNAIGTDILRAAALNSNNSNEFLSSLYESCKVFKESNLNQENTLFEDSYSSLNPTESIITKDASLSHTIDELNNEILLATENANIDIPTTMSPSPFLDIPSYDDCQYGLTNNGIETIKSIKHDNSHHMLCKLKIPNCDETPSNILYLQVSPYQNIVFYNPQNCQKIALKPDMIDNLILCENTITFNTFDFGAYEFTFYEEYIHSISSAKKLALWLNTHYNLKLITR